MAKRKRLDTNSYFRGRRDLTPKFKLFLERMISGEYSEDEQDAVLDELSEFDVDSIMIEAMQELEDSSAKALRVHYLGPKIGGWVIPRKKSLNN